MWRRNPHYVRLYRCTVSRKWYKQTAKLAWTRPPICYSRTLFYIHCFSQITKQLCLDPQMRSAQSSTRKPQVKEKNDYNHVYTKTNSLYGSNTSTILWIRNYTVTRNSNPLPPAPSSAQNCPGVTVGTCSVPIVQVML